VTGVLVMAYGGPDRLEDVEPYLLDIRNHRPTPPALVAEIRERYERIGGRSPILERTTAQAAALARALESHGAPWPVHVGMRHWEPRIADTLRVMRDAGIDRAIGVVMAPHYSRMSVGAYARKVEEADSPIDVRMLESWHLLPGYLDAVVDRVQACLGRFPQQRRPGVPVLFTAHSLPARILGEGDPYVDQLAATVDALRTRLSGCDCLFAYQSAAMTPEPWLGPDAGEVIESLASQGVTELVISPIGFTCEHVEVLYDIDVEYRALADGLGVRLERTAMIDDDERVMRDLAARIRELAAVAGWS
jgi:ferrochelatase